MAHDILIVDDEADIRTLIAGILEDEGYNTRQAIDGLDAIEAMKTRQPTLVILDIWLGDSRYDGLKVLEIIRRDFPNVPVLMISGHGTIETAVLAIKKGAYDFIEKPFKMEKLLVLVKRAIETARLKYEVSSLKLKAGNDNEFLGKSQVINQIRQTINKVAPAGSRILILGPSGADKEAIAYEIHSNSKRREAPFMVINCATINPDRLEREFFGLENVVAGQHQVEKVGILEQCHNGTLFLDEISDLPIDLQGKITRFLQEGAFKRINGKRKIQVDVRVIAATSANCEKAMAEGRIREDFYYRLSVVPIHVPPLRDRKEDISFLIEHYTLKSAKANGLPPKKFSAEALAIMQRYSWPGDMRQLRNVVEWVLIMDHGNGKEHITADSLPSELKESSSSILKMESATGFVDLPLKEARELFEREYLLSQISRFSGNVSQTASFIGMERSALHRKLRWLKINLKRR